MLNQGGWGGEAMLARQRAELEAENQQLNAALAEKNQGSLFPLGGKPKGVDESLWRGFGDIADLILQGTGGAERLVREGFEQDYAHRAGTSASAYRELTRRLGSQYGSQGLSPEVIQQMLLGEQVKLQSSVGQDFAENRSAMSAVLAELTKGTFGELAGVKEAQLGTATDLFVGERAAKAAEDAAKNDLLGSFANIGLSFL